MERVTDKPEDYPLWRIENNQLFKLAKPLYPRITGTSRPQVVPRDVHRVLKTTLAAYVKNKHTHSEKYLGKIGAAIRSATSDVINLTLNFLNFGREVCPTGKPESLQADSPSVNAHDNPDTLAEALKTVFMDVRKCLANAYNITRKPYDLRRRADRFLPGQTAWKRNYILSNTDKKFTSKLAPKYTGPHTISRVLSPWTYELTDQSGRIVGTWHGKDLKAHPPDDVRNDSPDDDIDS